MAKIELWIEGVSQPFTMVFRDNAEARAMVDRISYAATDPSIDGAPFVDAEGQELTFRLSQLRVIRLFNTLGRSVDGPMRFADITRDKPGNGWMLV